MADKKKWTVMVYMAGDNNLSADMAYALEDIRKTINGDDSVINLMVYYDSSAPGVPTLYCDFTDFKNPVYQASALTEKPFVINNKRDTTPSRNENSATMYSIMNFVNWCVNDTKNEKGEIHQGRRADKYALIFSGHSSAFQNMSFLIDTSSDYYMTIPKLRDTLDFLTRKDDFKNDIPLLKQEIDILGFDSCVMGMLELGYEFRDFAKTMVASEGNIPSAGWTYGKILTDLICGCEGQEISDFARGFVTNFINQQNKFIIGGVSVDLAAWNMSAVENVVTAADNLAKTINQVLDSDDEKSQMPFRLKKAILNCHWECQSFMLEQNIDLKDFCELLREEVNNFDPDDSTKLIAQCDEVIKRVDECILMCGFSGGKYQFANGISTYFPWALTGYQTFLKNYEDLSVYRDGKLTNWNTFLETFLTKHSMRKARVRNEVDEVTGIVNNVSKISGYYPTEKNNQVINDKNNHLINDKNNHLINDKNNHLINDKNNHLINDKNNHLINDKGLLSFLLTQFKNVETPWYISGFTKKELREKSAHKR